MKLLTTIQSIILLAVFSLAIVSCSNDDQESPIQDGDILLSTTVVNSDGQTGSSYVQVTKNLQEKSYDNKAALPFTFFHKPVVIDDFVYELPFFGKNEITKYKNDASGLQKVATMAIEENANPSGLVLQSNTKGYISFYGKGKILVFNPSTMKKISEINIESYGVGDENPDPVQMVLRGKELYVALGQSVGGFFPKEDRPYSDVLIINTETDKAVKMITEKKSGISTPTRPNDHNSIFMDENKDIYITGIAGYGARTTHKTGFLRIKNGQTDFDSTWSFPVESVNINGESKKVDYIQYSQYAGNGKLFAIANIPSFYSNPVNYLNDRTCVPVKIDLNNKTVKVITQLPRSNSYCSVTKYKNLIVFGLDGANSSGYFTYDINTGAVSQKPVVTVEGAPTGLYEF